MKPLRVFLISAVAVLALVLIGLAVALSSRFQTWAVRRVLAGRPDIHLTIGRVSAGFSRVELADVRWERAGVRMTAPAIVADLGVFSAGLRRHYTVSQLIAKGWTVSLPASAAAGSSALPTQSPTDVANVATQITNEFHGVLRSVALPFDLEIARVELGGTVGSAAHKGVAQVLVTGGDLGSGHKAHFDVSVDVSLDDEPIKSLGIRGVLDVTMDTPRTFGNAAAEFTATAVGPVLNRPVVLQMRATVQRTGTAESYTTGITQAERQIVDVRAHYPGPGKPISGEWRLDVRDSDLVPFALGRRLPTFAAQGGGRLDADAAFTNFHAHGTINASVDQLAVVEPSLSAVGAVKLTADVDVAQHGDVLSVTKFDVGISSTRADASGAAVARRVASVRSLQHFQFNPKSGALVASDVSKELIGIILDGVPLAWGRPFMRNVALEGGDLRGEMVASPRAGGFSFRSKQPLAISGLTVTREGKQLLRNLDVSLGTSGDYTPGGWQAEITGFTAGAGGSSILLLDARAGQLAGAGQQIKATGLVSLDLGQALAQPWAAGALALSKGDATVEFVANFGQTVEIQASVGIKNLAVDAQVSRESLPTLNATVRSDVARDGRITFNAPIAIERDGRSSDITIAGTFTPAASTAPGVQSSSVNTAGSTSSTQAVGNFDARVSSSNFVIGDGRVLAVVMRAREATPGAPGVSHDATPPWAGLNGAIALQLKKVVYTDTFQMNNVTGTLRLGGGAVRFEQVRAAVGEGGATVDGTVRFDAAGKRPIALAAEIALTDFDATPLFVTVNPRQPPAIEGKFTVATKVTARGASLNDLPAHVVGDFELTSRGGTFRGLPVNVGNLVENSGKLASWLASAGTAITSIAGHKDYDEITSRSQAANELAKMLSAIAYDQLAFVISRDEALNGQVKELALISPELRINGHGRVRRVPGRSLLNDVVELELHLRARGRPAELMKFLGVLEPTTDDLGYAACTIPIKVEGNLGRLDTTELSNRLVALAVAKTGLTEKAVDWINRLRGKGPN